MQIAVTVEGVEQTVKTLGAMATMFEDEVFALFSETAREIRKAARSLAPRGATGNLRQGIRMRRNRRRMTVRVYAGAPAFHAHLVEYGRKPGKMPSPLEIAQEIGPWAGFKGIYVDPFVLARAIGKKGTRPHPFMRPAAAQHLPALNAKVAQVVDRVSREQTQALNARP
jgi:HK97 gp10 family phage protein